jgi:hypothetical protein
MKKKAEAERGKAYVGDMVPGLYRKKALEECLAEVVKAWTGTSSVEIRTALSPIEWWLHEQLDTPAWRLHVQQLAKEKAVMHGVMVPVPARERHPIPPPTKVHTLSVSMRSDSGAHSELRVEVEAGSPVEAVQKLGARMTALVRLGA